MNISGWNLNLLRVFAAIYEDRTLTRAAAKVGLSQPALSHALKRLREAFDDELFVRQAGVYVPTRKAEELAEPILKALDTLGSALEKAQRFDPKTATKTFRLAVSDFASHTILPELCRYLHEQAPGVQCIVTQLSYEQYEGQLRSGEIDIAIILQRRHIPDINEEMIVEESAAYVARNGHPKLQELSTLDGLLSVDHLIVNLLGEANTWLDERLAELGKTRNVKMVVPYFSTVPEIVSKTDLVGVLPTRLATQAVNDYPVTMFALPFDFPSANFVMCWHARRQRDVELRWFRSAISEVCQTI